MEDIKSVKQFNRSKGRWGEAAAAADLERRGFEIVVMNFLSKMGEIDIIARKGSVFHFVEVKTRAGNSFGYGREAVTSKKQRAIKQTAKVFLMQKKLYDEVNCSFDVIEISGIENDYEIVHLENCF